MSTVLIVLFLLVLVVGAASLALGRATYEVDSARDTEFLELDGSWVRYDVIGGGPPVVLVHGWLSSSRIWEALARRLAQRFTVYSLDLTGFGESDKPLSGYGVRNGSRLLYAFCAHFGLTRASVIGHDLGGNMAVKLAADHPDVVGGSCSSRCPPTRTRSTSRRRSGWRRCRSLGRSSTLWARLQARPPDVDAALRRRPR
jgi:pimeloyl-ACP methyl ester carboxylesterase